MRAVWVAFLAAVITATSLTELVAATSSTISKDPGVYPGGRKAFKKGWKTLPDVAGATLDSTTFKVGEGRLAAYVSQSVQASALKRVVIQVHGMERDGWNQWLYSNLSLQRAVSAGGVQDSQVAIVAPLFLNTLDRAAYPSSSTLSWDDEAWGDGTAAVHPSGLSVGAFDALDAVVAHFLDTAAYPALVTVVVAGFSLGAQLVQRYSTLRPLNATEDARINYWVAAPNSYLYLNSSRPAKIARGCRSSYNEYKYGLEGELPDYVEGKVSEAVLAPRLLARRISYAVGAKDDASTKLCAANAQGSSHIAKMRAWTQEVLPRISGASNSLPSNSSVDYIRAVSHQPYRAIQSDSGVLRLFLEDFSARGTTARAPRSNGLDDDLGAASSAAGLALTPSGLALLCTCTLFLLSVLA
ncbi:unnamed protein product [Parajaminaea phylloscopi]